MALHGGSRPVPIKHDFTSKFYRELCPLCKENRLGAVLRYPVCMRCRGRLGLKEDLLKELKAHRMVISQETFDWNQKPHPTVSGTIDEDVPWKAILVFNDRWFVKILKPVEDRVITTGLIRQYLESITPAWQERAKEKKTPVRRRIFFIALGATLVTGAYFLKKHSESDKEND